MGENELYSDFFPVVLSFMRQLPVIGSFLSMPGVRQVSLSYFHSSLANVTDATSGNITGNGSDMWSSTISSLNPPIFSFLLRLALLSDPTCLASCSVWKQVEEGIRASYKPLVEYQMHRIGEGEFWKRDIPMFNSLIDILIGTIQAR